MATLQNPVEVGESIADRLAAATYAHLDAIEVAEKASALKRRLVLEAIDAGMPQGDVARIAKISRARVHAIVVYEASRG